MDTSPITAYVHAAGAPRGISNATINRELGWLRRTFEPWTTPPKVQAVPRFPTFDIVSERDRTMRRPRWSST